MIVRVFVAAGYLASSHDLPTIREGDKLAPLARSFKDPVEHGLRIQLR